MSLLLNKCMAILTALILNKSQQRDIDKWKSNISIEMKFKIHQAYQ